MITNKTKTKRRIKKMKIIKYLRMRRYKKMLIEKRIKSFPYLPLSVLSNVDREIIWQQGF